MKTKGAGLRHWQLFIFFCFIFYLATGVSHAAPIIYREQQEKAMKQQQAQMEYQMEYQQEQQGQQGAQGQGQQAPVQQTYQQQVDQRNQNISQAILNARNPATSNQNPLQSSGTGFGSQQQLSGPSGVKDTVDLTEVWKKLDNKSTIWTALMDDQAKILTVSEYLDRFHKEGVHISAPPMHYVQEIDQIVAQNPEMLQRPFGELLQIAAIVDYDFDNGMDKDELARKVLGEAGFEANKKRFTQQQ